MSKADEEYEKATGAKPTHVADKKGEWQKSGDEQYEKATGAKKVGITNKIGRAIGGGIRNVVHSAKQSYRQPVKASKVKVVRQPAHRAARRRPRYTTPHVSYSYRPAPARPSYDPFEDLVHGNGPGTDYFNGMLGSGKKKGKGRDPFKDLLG
jgi:hypothetical protein